MHYTKEDVIAARKLIESPENWCQESYARDALDNLDFITSDYACKFCAIGAVIKAHNQQEKDYNIWAEHNEVVNLFAEYVGIKEISKYNDENDHDKVLKAFDRLIVAMPD